MKQKIKWLVVGLFAFYTLFGFFILPYALEKKIPPAVTYATKGQFSVENISFNPFFFELDVEGVRFADPKGEELFTLKQGSINLELTSLFGGIIHLRNLNVVKPQFNLIHFKEGGLNIDWLMQPGTQPDAKKKPEGEKTALPRIVVDEFALYEGSITFLDETKEEPFDIELGPISLSVKHIDTRNLENSEDRIRLHAGISDGGALDIRSEILSLDPPALKGSVDFASGQLYTQWRYLQDLLKLEVADGKMHLHLDFSVDSANIDDTRIENLQFALQNLRIKPKEEHQDILRVGLLAVENGVIEPLKQKVRVEAVQIDGVALFAKRDSDGTVDWTRYIGAEETKEPETEQSVEDNGTKPAWDVNLSRVALHSAKVTFSDNAVTGTPMSILDEITFNAVNISSKEQHWLDYNASMRINQKGVFKTAGSLRHTPLHQKGALSLHNLQLSDLNPYLDEQAYVKIDSGALSFKSDMVYAPSESKPDLSLEGTLSLTDMLVTDTHDESILISFDDISVKPFMFELAPDNLFVEEVQINTLFANAFVDENKSFNFAQLQKKAVDETESTQVVKAEANTTKSAPFPVKIVKVSFMNGSANFADFSLPLRFQTHIHKLDGAVFAISSSPEETSYVDIKGNIDRYGSAKLKGSLNSANPKRFTDLALQFRNLALDSYTPYSANFAGRKIDEGKLFLDLGYHIVDSQMLGENSVIIKKIRLGDKVKSKDAVNLPLGLAIALLEDSEGVIDIELPVEGNVDKPDFKYGALVWKTLGNLITKAATAPFRFLGSLLGIEGDKLEHIEFEPGLADLLPPEREKLDALAKAMKKRPRISLGVSGRFDAASDRRAMQMEKVKTAALDMAKGAKKTEGDDALTTAVLEELYRMHRGEKAPEFLKEKLRKTVKDDIVNQQLYNKELLNALADLQEVTDRELKALGMHRAQGISTYLTASQGIAPERIKLKESVSSEEGTQKWVKTKLSIEVRE